MLKTSKAANRLIAECDDLICAVRENPSALANIEVNDMPPITHRNQALQHIGLAGIVIAFAKALALGVAK